MTAPSVLGMRGDVIYLAINGLIRVAQRATAVDACLDLHITSHTFRHLFLNRDTQTVILVHLKILKTHA